MKKRILSLILVLSAFSLHAAIELPALFSDGMILQRNTKLPVWGWAAEGDVVHVTFGSQSKSAKAGADGRWMLHLDPLEASSKGVEMQIQGCWVKDSRKTASAGALLEMRSRGGTGRTKCIHCIEKGL